MAADLARLEKALRAADAAGDTQAAQQLARAILDARGAPKQPGFGAQLTSAAVRPVAKGVAALPLMAMDAGVGLRNLSESLTRRFAPGLAEKIDSVTGGGPSQYELPSTMFNRSLDEFTLQPEGYGKAAEFVSSSLAGARTMPTPKPSVPSNYAGVQSARDMTLKASQDAGFVVPPSTTNPSLLNRTLESVGGKIGTAQDAAARNQATTNQLARRAVGLADDAELSPEALASVRSGAGEAYAAVREAGTITTDDAFQKALSAVTERFRGAAKDFPGLAKTDIDDVVKEVGKSEFSADSALDAISILRDRAATAYGQGDKALGKAYRAVSAALEDVIERDLTRRGEAGKAALEAFREARKLIAKTHSVEKALNPATGNVSAAKMGGQLARGAPLSGELGTIGRFGAAFPKAAREVTDSGSVRNTDLIVGGGAGAVTQQPWYLLYPYLRMYARNALLSPQGQALATPGAAQIPPGLLSPIPQANLLLGQ